MESQSSTEPELTGKKKKGLCQGFYEMTLDHVFFLFRKQVFGSHFAGLLSHSGCQPEKLPSFFPQNNVFSSAFLDDLWSRTLSHPEPLPLLS